MQSKFMFLHLSDIHIKHQSDLILQRAKEIAATTYQRLPEVRTVILVLSGDIAWSGLATEYSLAETFVTEIRQAIQKEGPHVSVEILVCPGNHDCDFTHDDDTREAVLARIRTLEDANPSESLVKTATSTQDAFFAFRDKISSHKWLHANRLAWQTLIRVGDHFVGIRCLNVAWMSQIKEKQGTLIYPPREIKPFQFPEHKGVSVTVLHHPFNWFGQATYRDFQIAVRRESQIIFTGHEHFQNVGESADIRSSPCINVDGGILFDEKRPDYSTYNVVVIDPEAEQYLTELYSWDGNNYLAEVDNEEWGSLRALPTRGRPTYELNNSFADSLTDAGANFSHSAKKKLLIDDVFVWPELVCLDDTSLIKRQVSGAHLEDINNTNSGVIIRGGEKFGKTTLLKQYFTSYYERGYLPLYFRGAWFTKSHQTEHLRALNFALERQYTKKGHQLWLQEPKTQKILLLDDIDSCRLSPDALSKCLEGLFSYFSAVIVTTRDSTAAMDLLSIDRVEALKTFSQYEIKEFGHKKRLELVCRWAQIGDQHGEHSEKWLATIDKWEKDLTIAVGHQFVPSIPIFLLTLLQSIEAGRTADLQNSAFGHYYQFLITSSFQNAGIDREQWNEVINYCAKLAWYYYSTDKKRIPDSELRSFNNAFSKEFTAIPFERRMRELIECGILAKIEGEIEFKYPYLYYYFLGQHLADEIHDPATETIISDLCQNLYLRDNANILLFTSHHTKSPVIYEKISEALEKCFEESAAFDFERDVVLLNQLVDSAPQLVYQEESAIESRMKIREKQDESTIAEPDEPESAAEPQAAVARLFRGMEILGQFLKNHYGTTRNPVKEELIDRLWQGALRGLYGTTLLLIENSDALAVHIERFLTERKVNLLPDEIKTRSRRVVFDIVGMVTYAFIHKAGAAVGSAYLKDNLQNVAEDKGTLAYSLIEMSYLLDLPEQIPFAKLRKLNSSLSGNVFSRELLRTMALRHLHLFKVPYKDKQKLCDELAITLNKQLALQHERSAHTGSN